MKYFKLFLVFYFLNLIETNAQHFVPGQFFYPVIEKEKYGYINSTGQWMINPKFEWCDYFYEGRAIAKEKGKYGFINIKGEWITKHDYDTVKHFSEGLAPVGEISEDGNLYWEYIDTAGIKLNLKVPALANLTNFNNGRASALEAGILNFFFFKKNGEIAFEMKDFYLDENRMAAFSEGLLHVYHSDGRSTFIDTLGRNWGFGDFENCGDFHNGMAWFQSNTRYGFINYKGQIIVPAEYDSVGDYSDGIALVKVKMTYDAETIKMKGGIVQYIDKEGKKITPPIYSAGSSFNDGFAFVKFNGKYGFIDKEGKVVIDYQFEDGSNFFRGLAFVKKENHWEYINTNGNKVF